MNVHVRRRTAPPLIPARPRRQDQQFLASALSILETPPAPLATTLVLAICSLFAITAAWAYFGRIDIIAVAQGKIRPSGNVKTIQSLEAGRVVLNQAENGRHVHAGDLLLALDPRTAKAEYETVAADLFAYRAEVRRRSAELEAVRGRSFDAGLAIAWPPDVPDHVRRREQRVAEADLAQLGAQMDLFASQSVQKEAERRKLIATIEAQRSLVSALQQRVDIREALRGTNSFSLANLLDSTEALRTQQTTLVQQVGQVGEIDAGLEVIHRDRDRTLRGFVAENSQKLDEADRQAASLSERLEQAEAKINNLAVRSPIDGVVQSSSVTTAGQVLSPGEEVMRIVPDGVELEIETYLPNKDIAFVKAGQKAVVKITSIPFTRYGTMDAVVTRVDHDAIPEPEASQAEQDPARPKRSTLPAGAERVQNLVYAVALRPLTTSIDIDGEAVHLGSGMEVTAEIRTGSRRIIDYVFAPLVQTRSEALRER